MRYVVMNRKGGVGKSSLAVNLAAVAAERGRRTLVVDLDPQANATHYLLGVAAAEARPGLADLFEETIGFHLLAGEPRRFVHSTPFANLAIAPADARLSELQPKLEARYKIYKLREWLDALSGFDEIWLDTPPAIGFYTTCALIAAGWVVIPFDCDEFSRRALYQLMGTVREVKDDHHPALEIAGIVVNLFQDRASLPRRLATELAAEGFPVLEPFVSASVKMRESHERQLPLVRLAPRHKVTEQLRRLHAALSARAAATFESPAATAPLPR